MPISGENVETKATTGIEPVKPSDRLASKEAADLQAIYHDGRILIDGEYARELFGATGTVDMSNPIEPSELG